MSIVQVARRPRNRPALLAQVPVRLAELHQRGTQLLREGTDINALWLLANDAEALADASARLGDDSASSLLIDLAESLWPLLDQPTLPDAAAIERISAALSAMAAAPASAAAFEGPGEEATLFGYAANDDNGFPLLVRPPAQYWRRFGGRTQMPVARMDSTPAPTPRPSAERTGDADVPPPAGVQTPASPLTRSREDEAATGGDDTTPSSMASSRDEAPHRIALHLGERSALDAELELKLRAAGYALRPAADLPALKEQLSRLTPTLVVVNQRNLRAVEEIGALVQAARARAGHRISWITIAAQADLAARLRVLRAGCDALVTLPATAGEIASRIEELGDAAGADPYRVMIIEDDRSQAMFAESILRKSGMQPLIVAEATAVLDQLDAFHPDLVLMDLHMPVCDGMELTALIREREAFISTPIVFLSGESDTERQFEALSAGGDDFLSKPIAPKHLIAAVTSRVRRARQLERRRTPSVREAVKGVHDIVVLNRRLGDMLAMEDAATRQGGLLFLEVGDGQRLRGRLGTRAFEALMTSLIGRLAARLGNADMLARCGDSGFLVLNPDRDTQSLVTLAQTLREHVSHAAFQAGDEALHLGIDVGICPFRAAAGDAKAMTETAERAMLEARSHDRGGIHVHEAVARAATADAIVAAIRSALDTSAFRVVFQPIVSLQGEEDEQFQALLRLPAGDGRVYAASELVPAAEAAGLIADVDRWMVEECIRTIGERLREGRSLRLFVSQSLASVREAGRAAWLRQCLDRYRVPASNLVLELRTDEAFTALPQAVAFALATKQLGAGVAMSGFEGGARGYEILTHLPIDFVKLSARYARASDDAVRAELRELVKVAHASGRRVIAPRVEDARAAAALWSGGVDLIQGNFVQQADRELSYDFHASAM